MLESNFGTRGVDYSNFRSSLPNWSALPPLRGMTPMRVPRSGCQEKMLPFFSASSKLKTTGQSMKITCSAVIAKSWIIDGQATSITSLRTSVPSRPATWYCR